MIKYFNFPLTYGLSKTGLPLVIVTLFEHELCLMLDTGSNRNLIDSRIYECYKESILEAKQVDGLLTLQGTTEKMLEVGLSFTFEGEVFHELFTCVTSMGAFDAIKNESAIQIHGILGSNFLFKHGWIIDFEEQAVYSLIS